MKRLVSTMLVIIIIMSVSTTAVYALPGNAAISNWLLSDSGSNMYIKILQYPKISMDETGLYETIFEMDLAASQKYFEHFKNGDSIPTLELNAINDYDRTTFKIALEDCTICGYTLDEIELHIGSMKAPMVRAVVKLSAEKITATNYSTAGELLQIAPVKMLDKAKLFINNTEFTGYAGFSGIEGSCAIVGNADDKTYGDAIYNNSELLLVYDDIGIFPDWMSGFDEKTGPTTSADSQCKLKYEFSSTTSGDKLFLEADVNVIGQELVLPQVSSKMWTIYTLQVLNFDIVTSPGADSAAVETTPAEPAPAAPSNLLIRGSNLSRVQDHTWSGNWVTTFGKMTLKQDGTKVTGEYGNPVETLEGSASGNKLAGTWHDSFSSGKFEFTMVVDGKSFKGTMYNQTLGDRGTFEWNGDRE